MRAALERLPKGVVPFARSTVAFMMHELRMLLFFPSAFLMTVAENLVNLGIWFFISLFLSGSADAYVLEYGGSCLAFSLSLQFGAVLLIVVLSGISIAPGADISLAPALYVLFILAVLGVGLIGASTFFHLEVKRGQEPIAWLVDYAVRLTSGLLVPLAVVPAWIRPLSVLLPHTYALRSLRLVLLGGAGMANQQVATDLLVLAIYAAGALALGFLALRRGLRRAVDEGGLSAVVRRRTRRSLHPRPQAVLPVLKVSLAPPSPGRCRGASSAGARRQ